MKIARMYSERSTATPDVPDGPCIGPRPLTRSCRVLSALLFALALNSVGATGAAEEPAPTPPAEKPAPAAPATPPPAVSKPFQLPVFEDGPWKGKFVVYEHANFDFWIDASGGATVQLKNNGKPIGQPFTFGAFGVYYVKPVDGRNTHFARRMVSVEKLTGPVKQPTKLVLKGKLEEILKGCELETHERVGNRAKRFVYPYAKILRFAGPVEEAVAKGPWGPREVKLATRNLKNLVFYGYVYTGMCPWEGYSFGVQLVTDDLSPGYRIILTVD